MVKGKLIQIQHLLKLNQGFTKNTCFLLLNSNTTLVKVKWFKRKITSIFERYSNTTLVKVKLIVIHHTGNPTEFKYNTC